MLQTLPVRGKRFTAAAIIAAGLLVAACGGDDDSDSSTESTPRAPPPRHPRTRPRRGLNGRGRPLRRPVAATPPPSSRSTSRCRPRSSRPSRSRRRRTEEVAFIVCADPSCVALTEYLKDAHGARVGVQSLNAPATDFGSAVQQAIDSQPDYIAGTGSDAAAFQPQYDARRAGIPYFTCYATDVPAGEENNLYADCYDSSAARCTPRRSSLDHRRQRARRTCGGEPPRVPDPRPRPTGPRPRPRSCPEFGVARPHARRPDRGGTPNAIVSFLQSNPDVNYVYLTYNGFCPASSRRWRAPACATR